MRDPDVLDLAAWEHRELHRALRALTDLEGDGDIDPDDLDALLSSVARHEALDRLLLYPLVDRDTGGRRSLVDRRAEQRSISDQLVKVRRLIASSARLELQVVVTSLHRTFTGHSDREEIEDFPQARRWSSPSERHELAELRAELRTQLQVQLPRVPSSQSRSDEVAGDRLGPVQIAIVDAKRILRDLDRSIVGAA